MRIIPKILSVVILLYFFGIASQQIFAEEITLFNSQIVASKDGSINITETIQYDFGSNERHGIYRDIPTVSKVGELYRVVTINFSSVLRDGVSEQYSISQKSNGVSVKIGDPGKTMNGVHTYVITYVVGNGIGSNYSDHDEIYWNVTGNSWQVPIKKAVAKIATNFDIKPNQAVCYMGLQGENLQDCQVSQNSTFNAQNLNPGEGLTAVAGFPANTFPKSVLQKQVAKSDLPIEIIAVPILLNFILAPILLIWYFRHKHKNKFGPISVNFDIPKDSKGKIITSAEAGTVDNAILDRDDITATIFDFAIRKLIRIEQVKDKDDFRLVKLKELNDGNEFENCLWQRLFNMVDFVKISSLSDDFYSTFDDLKDKIFKILVERKFYSKNPATQRNLLIVGTVISLVTFNFILGAILLFLSKKLTGRTALGDEADWKIDGLKLFLKNMSREYKWQADNLYTVEKYIPYAMALGYIKEFMEQLKVIYPNYQPNWYSGNLAFYAVSGSMFSALNSNFTTAAPSSSSGFSGGGFSGGGGGGGGGGSW